MKNRPMKKTDNTTKKKVNKKKFLKAVEDIAEMWIDEVKEDIESGEGLADRPTSIIARWNPDTGDVGCYKLYDEKAYLNLDGEDYDFCPCCERDYD